MVAMMPSNEKKPEAVSLLASGTAYASKLLRPWISKVLQYGPIPKHIAFIMDGNRRFANSLNKTSTAGHEYGYLKVDDDILAYMCTAISTYKLKGRQCCSRTLITMPGHSSPAHVPRGSGLRCTCPVHAPAECLEWSKAMILIERYHCMQHILCLQLLDALEWCLDLGISCVSVYAFSIDNFKRPPQEVAMLMQLAEEKLDELLQVQDGCMRLLFSPACPFT